MSRGSRPVFAPACAPAFPAPLEIIAGSGHYSPDFPFEVPAGDIHPLLLDELPFNLGELVIAPSRSIGRHHHELLGRRKCVEGHQVAENHSPERRRRANGLDAGLPAEFIAGAPGEQGIDYDVPVGEELDALVLQGYPAVEAAMAGGLGLFPREPSDSVQPRTRIFLPRNSPTASSTVPIRSTKRSIRLFENCRPSW